MNFRVPIFIICFLETLWYTFSIALSWFEIGKIYYDWTLRLQESLEYTNIAWLSIGITAPTISLIGTFILFFVAFNDGARPNLIFLYIIKNSITLTLEITFFGRSILDIWSGNVQLDQGMLSIAMFCLCGVFAPVLFALVAYH